MITGPIRKAGVGELLGRIPDIPWEWVKETDSQLRAGGLCEEMKEERRKALDDDDDIDWEELEG